ncbi:MAG: hypothetical protein IIY82_07970 [Firmicutes bacterium]|nr:hypothetical protein [Bacillota bacterium]
MAARPHTTRQYFISIQKWRSLIALIACIVTLLFSLIAIGSSLVKYARNGWAIADLFRYFTTLANMITALAASFLIPFAINGIRKKRFVTPKWLSMLHYTGTVSTTLILVFALVFILPFDPEFAIGGSNFFLHIVCPIAVLISYELVESKHVYSRKDLLVCLLPIFCYSLVYLVMVVLIGEERGGWEDLYMLNTFVPAYVSLPLVWLLALAIALGIRFVANRLNRRRQNQLTAAWKADAEPVEINIEIYGLGRFYGLHGDRNDLSVPLDILESLAGNYAMPLDNLIKVYMKGLLDGIKDRDRQAR